MRWMSAALMRASVSAIAVSTIDSVMPLAP